MFGVQVIALCLIPLPSFALFVLFVVNNYGGVFDAGLYTNTDCY